MEAAMVKETAERAVSGSGRGNEAERELPLSLLRAGESGIVRRLEGGEEFRCKMLALGLAPGRIVTIARNERHQPCVLRLDGGRLMMDRRIMERIQVQPADHAGKGGLLR